MDETKEYIANNDTRSDRTKPSSGTDSPESSPRDAPSASLFDIQTSEEDISRPKTVQPLKKRKTMVSVSIPSNSRSRTTKTETAIRHESKGHKAKTLAPPAVVGMKGTKSIPLKPSSMKVATGDPGLKKPPRQDKAAPAPRRKDRDFQTEPIRRTARPDSVQDSSGSSAHLSDDSIPSRPSRQSTPKRKRDALEENIDNSPSPSELQMRSLKLTSDVGPQALHKALKKEEMAEATASNHSTRKGRTRLIDRLDVSDVQSREKPVPRAPSRGEEVMMHSHRQLASGSTSPRKPQTVHSQPPPSVPNVPPLGRQRATYAKQRSHLSDMMDGLDGYQGSNSQESSQHSLSQLGSFTMASQMDLDNDDSDDADTFSHIKSIHELRRGGAIRKFDLDLHTILEDIESGSKSLRIQALLQLLNKVKDLSFLRHFEDSSVFQRLTECANEGLDQISATLMVLVFQEIISGEKPSPRNMSQVLRALYHLPPLLLSERRSLSKLARDRSQNLTKLLVNDIVEFDEHRSKEARSLHRAVRLIFLGSINATLRNIISAKERIATMPHLLRDEVLSSLTRSKEDMLEGSERDDGLENVQLLLSLLEIACANHELSGPGLSMPLISGLGGSIADVMTVARQVRPETEHSCLRLIVSLSNNEPEVCEVLAEGSLMSSVFQVIDDHFLPMAALAAQAQEFDPAQLESVILAVGCLLNLAECAEAARETMLKRDSGGTSLVDRLVDIFNSHVDQTSEVRRA